MTVENESKTQHLMLLGCWIQSCFDQRVKVPYFVDIAKLYTFPCYERFRQFLNVILLGTAFGPLTCTKINLYYWHDTDNKILNCFGWFNMKL